MKKLILILLIVLVGCNNPQSPEALKVYDGKEVVSIETGDTLVLLYAGADFYSVVKKDDYNKD